MSLPAFVWLLLSLIWGTTWLALKVGLEDLPPVTFAALRFVVASVPLVLWLAIRRAALPRTAPEWRLIAVTALLNFTVNYSLVFWGSQYISSGLAAILYTTFPLFGLLLAHAMLPLEPLTTRRLAGTVIAVLGVALIFYNQIAARGTLAVVGSLAIVIAAAATAYADVIIKRSGTHLDPVVLSSGQMVIGFTPMLLVGIPLEGNPLDFAWTGRSVAALLYLALVGSAFAFVLLYWLIQRMAVTRVMLIPVLSTFVAVILGIVVLGEPFQWRVVAGGAAILLGLWLATREPMRVVVTPEGPVGEGARD